MSAELGAADHKQQDTDPGLATAKAGLPVLLFVGFLMQHASRAEWKTNSIHK